MKNLVGIPSIFLVFLLLVFNSCDGGGGGGGSVTPNAAPTVNITSPADVAEFSQGEPVVFRGTATDPEDGALTGASLVWTSSIDGSIGTGTYCTRNDLSAGRHAITLTATDSGGKSATDLVTIRVRANQPPTASITSPADGTTFLQGSAVTFQGSATDPEDGGLTGASLVWTSSIDGDIGTGESFSRDDLSLGTHTITLTATDSGGGTGSDSVTIRVRAPNQPPVVTITSPADGARFLMTTVVTFEGSAVDPEDGTLAGGRLVWTSSLDGNIGTGGSFTRDDLSLGTHTITLTATDSEGASGTDTVTVEMVGGLYVYLLKTDANGNQEWDEYFSHGLLPGLCSVKQTADGGYAIAAGVSFDGETSDFGLFKTDPAGVVEWQKSFGARDEVDGPQSLQQTTDGGYVLAGGTYWPKEVVYLVKADSSGELDWEASFRGIDRAEGQSVCQTVDGGYVVVGATWSESVGPPEYTLVKPDVYLVKTSASGELEWEKTFGGDGNDWGLSVWQTGDTGYIIAGQANYYPLLGQDVYLVKTDPSGAVEWQKVFGADYPYPVGSSVQQTSDGGYVIAGWTDTQSTHANSDFVLIRTNSLGNLLWEKTFGGPGSQWCWSAQQTIDEGYIMVGDWYTGGTYMVKTDSSGNLEWEKTFVGFGDASVQQTTDGGYIIAGHMDYQYLPPRALPGDNGCIGLPCSSALMVKTLEPAESDGKALK